jgi:hypothetical protein
MHSTYSNTVYLFQCLCESYSDLCMMLVKLKPMYKHVQKNGTVTVLRLTTHYSYNCARHGEDHMSLRYIGAYT